MKGLTHFISGVAAATFIPQAVRMSISSRMDVEGAASSFIIVLAGMYGILPDTLDFKFGQFFELPDFVVDPDPRNPDPEEMARKFKEAVEKADATGKEVKIQYFPTQLGTNKWRQYCIIFEDNKVSIQLNEEVSTSQIPFPGTAPKGKRVGSAEFGPTLKSRSEDVDWLNKLIRFLRQKLKGPDRKGGSVKPSTIDILSSTMFGLKKEADGRIYFNWLPWHRTWSHSYVLGALLALPVLAITYLLKLEYWWLYPIVAFVGMATHITEDMTGHIGGSLLWPLLKPRTEGFELFKASDPRTNFSVIYTAFILIIFNIDRFTTKLITGGPGAAMPWWLFLLLFLVIPLAVYFKVVKVIKKKIDAKKKITKGEEEDEEPDGMGDAVID
ncbi:MAG: metal-dependent hydrolase [Elusimicrobiota bacterium]|nr:metal-dependent hydrolase [Elusimicrobiota bacterium]